MYNPSALGDFQHVESIFAFKNGFSTIKNSDSCKFISLDSDKKKTFHRIASQYYLQCRRLDFLRNDDFFPGTFARKSGEKLLGS
jgi:hypothetical protein